MEQVGSIAGLVALIVSIWALAQNRAGESARVNELSEAHKDERRRMNRVIDRLLERVI